MQTTNFMLEKVIREKETIIPLNPNDVKGCMFSPYGPPYFPPVKQSPVIDRGITHRNPERKEVIEVVNIKLHKKRWLNND